MKYFFTTLCFAVGLLQHALVRAQHVNPQSDPDKLAPSFLGMHGMHGIPVPRSIHYAGAKTTAAASRLAAAFTGYGTPAGSYRNSDSVHHTYSGNRGGDLDSTPLSDVSVNYKWDTASNSWTNFSQQLNTYDGANHLIQQISQTWSGVWQNSYRYFSAYDAAGLDTADVSEYWDAISGAWKPSYRIRNTYAGNRLSVILEYVWSTATSSYSIPATRTTYTYTSAGEISRITGESYNLTTTAFVPMYRYSYLFNAANKWTLATYEDWNVPSASWKPNYRFAFYYNTADQLIADTHMVGSGMAWVNADSTFNLLNAAGDPLTEQLYQWKTPTSTWSYATRHTNTYAAPSKLSQQIVENVIGGGYQTDARYTYTYNSFSQLTREYGEKWNGSTWIINTTVQDNRWYYEGYDNGLGITPSQGLSADDMQLYPVPAYSTLTVTTHFAQPMDFSAAIGDASGKIVAKWEGKAQGLYSRRISVSDLPAGMYFLSIRTANGTISKPFTRR